jgi:hypothetical protein
MTDTAVRPRRGLRTPPVGGPIDREAILSEIDQAEQVRLRDLSRQVGWTQTGQKYAIRKGLLAAEPAERGRAYVVSRDEAYTLLLAALLAFAAGVAIAAMLRALKGAGLEGAAAADAIRNMTT